MSAKEKNKAGMEERNWNFGVTREGLTEKMIFQLESWQKWEN